MPDYAKLLDMVVLLWGKDPSSARRPPFDISPCLRGEGVSDDNRVHTLFEGMLGFLRIDPRPDLCLKPQATGLVRGQSAHWVAGQYDQRSKLITVWMPEHLTTRDDVSLVAGTLAHEVAHHYLSTRNDELAREAANEILTDVAAVWIGFGSVMGGARQKFAAVYKREVISACTGYIGHESIGRLERLRRVLSREPRPVGEWLRSTAPLAIPDYPIVAKLEDGELQNFYIEAVPEKSVFLVPQRGTARTLVRISHLRYLKRTRSHFQ